MKFQKIECKYLNKISWWKTDRVHGYAQQRRITGNSIERHMSQPTAADRVHGYAQQLRITGNSIERHMSQPTAVRL